MQWLKREHGAVDVSQQSHSYLEQLMDLETPEREDMEALKVFWEKIQERERRVEEISDDIFPMDFHIYELKCPEKSKY